MEGYGRADGRAMAANVQLEDVRTLNAYSTPKEPKPHLLLRFSGGVIEPGLAILARKCKCKKMMRWRCRAQLLACAALHLEAMGMAFDRPT